ncbi:unnamed protein product [Cylindrotheca closterium]|uniref:Uncharacterized protein n=1 Tax=Cylindrotheca closterium TaxID=2856 RepID=A0AAD2G1T5_9STRA|nr:unnamed protein product [Cylindrotheca closterium]
MKSSKSVTINGGSSKSFDRTDVAMNKDVCLFCGLLGLVFFHGFLADYVSAFQEESGVPDIIFVRWEPSEEAEK